MSLNHTIPKTPTTSTTNLGTLSAVAAPPTFASIRKDNFFANWICGNYDMKWLSHEENEDLRLAERRKLCREELEALGFTEPY